MGKATERLFLPLMRLFLPEIVDVHMPPAGVFHNLVLVSIRKRYPGHARKVMHGLWGLGLLMLAKAIVVVDEWVDVQNLRQAAWQALGNVDWQRDVVVTQGPVDQLDHASAQHVVRRQDRHRRHRQAARGRPRPRLAAAGRDVAGGQGAHRCPLELARVGRTPDVTRGSATCHVVNATPPDGWEVGAKEMRWPRPACKRC